MADDFFSDLTAPQDYFGDLAPEGQPVPESLRPPMRFVPQGVPRETPREPPGFVQGVGAGLEAGVSGVAETGEALVNRLRGQPMAEPSEVSPERAGIEGIKASEALTDWEKFKPWAGYMLGRGAPAIAGATAGAPLGVAGVMAGSGLGQFLSDYGPRFREQVEAGVPEDQALRAALKSAGVTAGATALQFGLPLGVVVQLLGQPTVSGAENIIQNYLAGQPLFQGTGEALAGGLFGGAMGAATHYMTTRGRARAPEAVPKPEAEAPPEQPPARPPAETEPVSPEKPPPPPPAEPPEPAAPTAPTRPPAAEPDLFMDYIMGREVGEAPPPAAELTPPEPVRGPAPRPSIRVPEPRVPEPEAVAPPRAEPRAPEERVAPPARQPPDFFSDLRPTEEPPPAEPPPRGVELDLSAAEPAPEAPRAQEPAPAEPGEPLAAPVSPPPPKIAKQPPRESLLQFIRRNGGIDPSDPMISDFRGVVGKITPLIRKGGKTLDEMRELAASSGRYLPLESTIPEFLDLASKDATARLKKDEAGRVYPRGEEAPAPAPMDERAQAQEAQAQKIRGAFEAEGLGGEVDPYALNRAADLMYRGEESDPFRAYERGVQEEVDAALQREGARGEAEAPAAGGEPRKGPRTEKALIEGGREAAGPGAPRRAPRKEVPPEALAHLYGTASEKIGRRIAPLDSVPLRTALGELDLRHLGNVSTAVSRFVRGRLERAVGDTPVHFVSEQDMAAYRGVPAREAPLGLWVQTEEPHTGRKQAFVLINADILYGNPEAAAHAIYHEGTHAAAHNAIENNPKFRQALRTLMDEVEKRITTESGRKPYALTDEHEFLSEAFSRPDMQEALQRLPTPPKVHRQLGEIGRVRSAWDSLAEMVRRVLGLPSKMRSMLETVMRVGAEITAPREVRGPSRTSEAALPKEEPGAEGKPQLVIPGAEQRPGEALRRKAAEPLKPKVAQKPMDEGLFGETASQEDLFAPRTKRTEMPAIRDAANERLSDKLAIRNYNKLSKIAGFGNFVNPTELRVRLQDRFLRIKRLMEQWQRDNPGQPLPDSMNVYQAEALSHGKIKQRMDQFDSEHVDPLIKEIDKQKLTYGEVGQYIKAKHAPERNRELRKINPQIPDPAGMSDADAASILQAAAPRQAQFDAVYKRFRTMADETLKMQIADGLIDPQIAAYLQKRWPDYAPMRHTETGEGGMSPGRGLEVRGPETLRAYGRTTEAENPIAYAVEQGQRAIVRGEHNDVGRAMGEFVAANPDPSLWRMNAGPQVPYVDPRTGQVRYRTDPQFRKRDDVFTYKENGKEQSIWFTDPVYGKDLARALKNLEGGNVGAFFRSAATVTRLMSRLATSWNPEFMTSNFFRDVGEAVMNLPAEKKRGLALSFAKHLMPSIKGALKGQLGGLGYYADMFREFEREGGRVGYLGIEDPVKIQANIQKRLQRLEGGKLNTVKDISSKVLDGIEIANNMIENATRLATYIAARENGFSMPKSASIAREVTINFNRKGEWGSQINALYMFANAGIQGPMRMMNALKTSKVVRRGAMALASAGAALAMYNLMAGGQDKDGKSRYSKIAPWERDQNFILMYPDGSGRYTKVPAPFGYGMFKVVGDHLASWLYGDENFGTTASAIMSGIGRSFNPLGQDESYWALATPSILRPVPHMMLNRDAFGRPIRPDDMPWNKYLPESERSFRSNSPIAKSIAKELNQMTGGTSKVPGWGDVSPGVVDYFMGFVGGGLGRFAYNLATSGTRVFNGQEWEPRSTPFVRRFYGEETGQANRSLYFQEREKVRAAEQRKVKGPEANVAGAFKAADKERTSLLKQMDAIQAGKAFTQAEKDRRVRALQLREQDIMLRARRQLERSRAAAEKRRPTFSEGGLVPA